MEAAGRVRGQLDAAPWSARCPARLTRYRAGRAARALIAGRALNNARGPLHTARGPLDAACRTLYAATRSCLQDAAPAVRSIPGAVNSKRGHPTRILDGWHFCLSGTIKSRVHCMVQVQQPTAHAHEWLAVIVVLVPKILGALDITDKLQ